jgi:chromosome segregation protein
MYFKRLELQGFKTFIARTEFVFDTGITAVVGPNGSGKSNIADAVRWVLGEQSTRALRIKRTEDVIFGGSAARTRLGMAEVSITFDNADHWLPLDFGEVTITRRAYRSGENEYFINKSKVRLRDVVDLLLSGNLGQNNYTVIGQGTVDAALSLRPEERRGLFEEAADIKRYQLKRADALDKLEATESNLVRISDILAEIGPRAQLLKEQAGRAQEHATLNAELRGYLATWYRHLWAKAQEGLVASQAAEAESRSALISLQAESDQRAARLDALRRQEQERRAALGDWHRQASVLHAQVESLERQLAVDGERSAQMELQRQDLLQEVIGLEENAASETQRLRALEAQIAALEAEGRRQAAQVQAVQAELTAHLAERSRCERELNAAQETAYQLATSLADSRQRLNSLGERRTELNRGLAEHAAAVTVAASQGAQVAGKLAALVAGLDALDTYAGELTLERGRLQTTLTESQGRQPALQAALGQKQQARQAAQTRLELLSRLQHTGEGYAQGVRAVLSAAGAATRSARDQPGKREGGLTGIVGTVASLVQVPAELETAVETALGGHLQDIVTETWDEAAAAIALLKEGKAGRCTFWPLKTVRPGHRGTPSGAGLPGVVGAALDLVTFDERYRNVFANLLGNILVVRDLNAARAASAAGGGATLVTLGGELVRPAGSVTGGAQERAGSGVLAREREVRELPAQIAATDTDVAQAQALLDRERLLSQQMLAQIAALEEKQQDLSGRRQTEAAAVAAQRQQASRVEQEVAWRETLRKQAQGELDALNKREVEIKAALVAGQERQSAAQSHLEELRKRLDTLDPAAAQARMAEARMAAALGEQELRSQRTSLAGLHANQGRLMGQVAAKRARAAELAAQAQQAAARTEAARSHLGLLSVQLAQIQSMIDPAEAEIAQAEAEQTGLSAEESAARNRLMEAERAATRTGLEVGRAQEELAKLQAQIESEDALRLPATAGRNRGAAEDGASLAEDLPGRSDFPHQLRLELNGSAGRLSPLMAMTETPLPPEQVKRQVDRLRGQIRALGAINPNAVAEYEETQQRHTFLSTQSDDLHQAGKSLRSVVAELDGVMRKRFTETFRAVAEEFKRYFGLLFNGGTARLILTDPDDPQMTGIDIVAQPPGKRMQSLALLSGGERALTATALLFAILTVNPTPFCVLDEVDAALDEANVERFRQALMVLAERTQFIIITHNRGTMESARALYGVSMGEDGASRVISLKLDEAKARGSRRDT